MSMRTGLWTYAWDLADEGIAEALDRMTTRAGADTVFVAALYHSGKFLHVHNPRRRVVFPQSGTLYFPASPQLTERGRIRAPVWSGPPEFWDQLRGEADARGVDVMAWMLCLHNSGIGWAHPDCAVVNAFGDTVHTDLCAHHPDVGEFLDAAARAVAALPVDGILLESLEYMPFRHGYHHEVIGVPTGPTVDFLMSLCFCEHCHAAARERGLELDAVRRWTRETLDAHFADPFAAASDGGWCAIREGAGGRMPAFLDLRSDAIVALLERIAGAVRETSGARLGAVDFGPLYPLGPDVRRWENGVDLDRVLPLLDEIHPCFYFTDQAVHEAKAAEYRRLVAGERPVMAALRAILPQTDSAERLAEQVRALAPDVAGLSFYNYGFMPLSTLDWIRDAVAAAEDGGSPAPSSE